MGVYSGSISYNSSNDITGNVDFETLMESNIDMMETDDFEEGSLNAVCDITENYNAIMTAIGITEAVALERTGQEFVWTEGVLSDFGNKIKSFFKKIWEKISSLFKRAIQMFDSYSMQDKAFVKKYRKEIFSGKDLSDFTFKGWNFSNLDEDAKIKNAIDECEAESFAKTKFGKGGSAIADVSDRSSRSSITISGYDSDGDGTKNEREKAANSKMEKIEDDIETIRGTVFSKLNGGSVSKLTADEFRKEVKEWIHGNETEKEELDKISVTNLTDYLVGSKTTTKKLNDLFKQNKKKIDDDIKYVERLQKEDWNRKPLDPNATPKPNANDKDKAAAVAVELSYALRCVRETKEILITLDGLLVAGYKERSRQYKACLVKIMHYNPKSESYNESYSYNNDYSYSGSNFLSGVELK